jgi:hypothetical protein
MGAIIMPTDYNGLLDFTRGLNGSRNIIPSVFFKKWIYKFFIKYKFTYCHNAAKRSEDCG